MYEKYKKEIKKYDFQLRMDTVFKIVFVIMIIFAIMIIFFPDWSYLFKLLIILIVEVIAIAVGLIILCLYNVYKFKTSEKNIFKRFNLFINTEEINRTNFVVNLLKEYNVNTPDKIVHIINFYKNKYQKFTFSTSQSIFGLIVIFMGMSADYYDLTLKGLDVTKLSFSVEFTIIAILLYGILEFLKFVCSKILFSTNYNIIEKFINILNYFYLHFEEYEEKLKK